ncbi:MAG: enoyl-CoA hydratase/isomerase family protein [Bacteroidetes bacterium]|nr:enoyl-CoA hydratase/isomerase family protein [Bacteroidota bacterium]
MNRKINKVAVLGSGVMGSRIACLFAGIGVEVLLLDILPKDLPEGASKAQRNKLVNDELASTVKSNPSPIYQKEDLQRIVTGNFDDDLSKIKNCDWIIEVVIERLDIKKQLFEKVDACRKPGSLITSNTSGIPIHLLAEGRSKDFKENFCGTHFFNPPRYLRLLEIIPSPETKQEVIDFLLYYGDLFLGKTVVHCKDTPAFIANRIGVFSMMAVYDTIEKIGLTIDELDLLTGPISGRPKSATFRTSDVIGLDTLVKVAKGVYDNVPDDERRELFQIPAWLNKMLELNMLGDKSGQGFFKKNPATKGSKKEIQVLNLTSFEYEPRVKPSFKTVDAARSIEDLGMRMKMMMQGTDKAGEFYRHFNYSLFSYVSFRVPEISDELYSVDDAIKAGFGWEIGVFELLDVLGVSKTMEQMNAAGFSMAPWVSDMLSSGCTRFYKTEKGKKFYYDLNSKSYKEKPGSSSLIILSNFTENIVWKNANAALYDIGDDILALQWHTKMNTIGGEVIEALNKGITMAEEKFKGLVIANDGPNFSAGANVGMIFMYAVEQDYDELNMAIKMFQDTMMRVRYSAIPVIVAPHGLALGGGCELSLHADKIFAAAETYIGLVELGVGLIPGGGGTKEFTLRASNEMHEDEPETITLKNRFLTIATAKVATSAFEAYQNGILRNGHDEVVMNMDRRILESKNAALQMFNNGYSMPVRQNNIQVLGRSALGALYAGINGMMRGNYATEHDALIARKLAYVMCGGDLSEKTRVNEQYLLDLEREAFLSLCGEKKTLERLQSVIKTGKPVRN